MPTSTARRVSRVVLSVFSALVLLMTVVGAGVSVVMSQLQGNITAVDVSEQIGPVASWPVVRERHFTVRARFVRANPNPESSAPGCRLRSASRTSGNESWVDPTALFAVTEN